jgi:hypothetical protein
MTLQRLSDGSVRVANLDEWHLQMLRSIPSLAVATEDDGARQRLFPRPFSAGDATEEAFHDWDEFVRPGLEQLFNDSIECVTQDLAGAAPEEPVPPLPKDSAEDSSESPPPRKRRNSKRGPGIAPPDRVLWGFKIPAGHVEHWYRAMNQVRLVLSAKHEAHRTDNEHIANMFISGKMETLIQYELFTGLCSWWVEALLRP